MTEFRRKFSFGTLIIRYNENNERREILEKIERTISNDFQCEICIIKPMCKKLCILFVNKFKELIMQYLIINDMWYNSHVITAETTKGNETIYITFYLWDWKGFY